MDQPRISKGLSLSKARSVGKQIKSSLPWVAVEAVVNVIYGAAMVGVIGWLIPPSEFGAASAALAAIYLVETFSKAGIQDALIRERSIHTEVTDVGHTTSVGLSIIGMIVSIAIAFPLSRVMDDNRIASFILVSSFIFAIKRACCSSVGNFYAEDARRTGNASASHVKDSKFDCHRRRRALRVRGLGDYCLQRHGPRCCGG